MKMNTKLKKPNFTPTKEELLNYERQIDLKWKLKEELEYCTLPQLIEIKKIMEEFDKKSLSNLNED